MWSEKHVILGVSFVMHIINIWASQQIVEVCLWIQKGIPVTFIISSSKIRLVSFLLYV